jgi:hypothetical protein
MASPGPESKILLKKKSRFSRESPVKKPPPVEQPARENITSDDDVDESSDPEEYDVRSVLFLEYLSS